MLRRDSLRFSDVLQSEGWARQDSNLGPRDYESPALTAELQAHLLVFETITANAKIWCVISPGAIMRGHSATAKKFGKVCAQRISQLRKRGWPKFLREHREKHVSSVSEASAKMTFGGALKIHQQNQADDVTIKPATRHYWNQIFVALLKSWPGLADREIRRITKTDCNEWARRFRKIASSKRYNNTLAGLRHVFDVAD